MRIDELSREDLRALQERLELLGFDPGRIDGIWGPRTARAYEAYLATRPVPGVLIQPAAAKPWYLSKRIIGSVVAMLAAGAGIAGTLSMQPKPPSLSFKSSPCLARWQPGTAASKALRRLTLISLLPASACLLGCAGPDDRVELKLCRPTLEGIEEAMSPIADDPTRSVSSIDWSALQPGVRCPY